VSLPGDPLRYSQAPSGCGSPAFQRYYETSKTAPPFDPAASVSLADRLLRRFPVFARNGPGKPGRCAWTLLNRCRPCPVVRRRGVALPAFQETPVCLCPALRPRSGRPARGLRPLVVTTYCGQGDAVPPGKNRKTQTAIRLSGFNHAASALAPYASCAPCGNATQCSLPSGGQPFSGGISYPLGFANRFIHSFVCFLLYCLLARSDKRLHSNTHRRSPGVFSAALVGFAVLMLAKFSIAPCPETNRQIEEAR
jgi:hypothetical protein